MTHKSMDFKGVQVHYTTLGSGPALVLLHGFLENRSMWNALAASWATQHKVIRIDLLGHGETGCLGYVHNMETQAELVYEVIRNEKLRRVSLVGHSMGGYIGMALVEAHPNVVKHLVLMNSTTKEDSLERQKNRDRAIVAVKQNHQQFVGLAVANLFSMESRERLGTQVEEQKKISQNTPLQGIVAALEGMKIRKDRSFLLEASPTSFLFILGEKDEVLPYAEHQALALEYGVACEVIADGHMSHLEQPEKIRTLVSKFIKNGTL